MPTYATTEDGRGGVRRYPADEVGLEIPDGLDVRRIVVTNLSVTLVDGEGRESVAITKGSGPGAGLAVELAEHVEERVE